MRHLALKTLVKLQDRCARLSELREDDEGLTLVAYALGAAIIIAPLAILLVGFGDAAVTDAQTKLDGALAP